MITSVTKAVLMYVAPYVNNLLFFSDFNQSFLFSTEFSKNFAMNCTKVRSFGPSGYMQTDRHDESSSRFPQLY
jgi:hypothetical protein